MRYRQFGRTGLEVSEVASDDVGRPDVDATLEEMGARGITRVLVEGGPHIVATFLRAGAVDRLAWFRAPDVIGGDGLPAAIRHLTGVARQSEDTFDRREESILSTGQG